MSRFGYERFDANAGLAGHGVTAAVNGDALTLTSGTFGTRQLLETRMSLVVQLLFPANENPCV